jgi:hypothetical protein
MIDDFVFTGRLGSGVGTPVTGRPRHRPGRAVFPHPVPRSYSLPRGPLQLPVSWPNGYCPLVCSLVLFQPDSVRHEFPLRATCSPGVLRHAAGFPDLRLLCPIRHPSTLALASLPDRSWFLDSTRAHAVSGLLTLSCPNSGSVFSSLRLRSLWGFLGSSTYLFLHATACGLRRTSTPSPLSHISRVLLCCLRCTLKPSASGTELVEAVPALQGARSPLRPTGCSVYAGLTSLFAVTGSAVRPRLDTGGWLALTRRGLSPRKIRRALPSAITHAISRRLTQSEAAG